ncbi:MAG: hypothetical protein JW720_03785 [Sedimentisphaerales bacterium]|nr:hypothetical protein [Sedimentisphaerales bacterium]
MKIFHKTAIILTILISTACLKADELPVRVIYKAVLPANPHPKMIRSVEIAIAPDQNQSNLNWHRITCTKASESPDKPFVVWILTGANLFPNEPTEEANLLRYIVQEPGQSPVEYINQRTGRAMPPLFSLTRQLLPHATVKTDEILFEKGVFLGHPIIRSDVLDAQVVTPPENIMRLVLNPDLLIGTSRNFRDDGKGRKSEKDNYNYIGFTEKEYDEMIDAGFNYFTAADKQIEYICRKPVFYEGYSPAIDFPEELFRSNFRGLSMFIDEPASRLAGKYARDASPIDAVKMIQAEIRNKRNNKGYQNLLLSKGIDLGDLELIEPDVPIWETYIGTAWYQLEAYPYGLVQECRWQINPGNFDRGRMLQRINAEFDTDIPVKPENLFLWYYSQIIGPARHLNARWGMSIYGHAEHDLRLPSMKLAYDLGASFIWFWTSDHNHHVPYTEQLALTRAITDYAKAHPRPPLRKLMKRAKTVIVLPYGYTLPACWELDMFGSYIYPINRKNEFGLTYKEVLSPAIRKIEYCLKNGTPYDVVPAGKAFDPNVYEEIIRITEDRDGGRE